MLLKSSFLNEAPGKVQKLNFTTEISEIAERKEREKRGKR
jgi:hypothetical protein